MSIQTRLKIDNYVLIIGAMKCGTTSLFNILAQHPQVAPCSYKEPAFFAFNKRFSKGIDYYQSLWNWDDNQHKIALEASTGYTKIHFTDFNCAENIAKFKEQANFKFIYILRNPIDRIESQYRHSITSRTRKLKEIKLDIVESDILDTSKYALQIAEYYKRFPKENILLLDFDDLKNVSPEWIQNVCRFLEIDDSYNFNDINNIYHDSSQKRLHINWRQINNPMIKNLSYLFSNVPFKYKKLVHNIFGDDYSRQFKLSDKQKTYIIEELRDDLLNLEKNYQFDISKWNLFL